MLLLKQHTLKYIMFIQLYRIASKHFYPSSEKWSKINKEINKNKEEISHSALKFILYLKVVATWQAYGGKFYLIFQF